MTVLGKTLTTFCIGGPMERFRDIESVNDLKAIILSLLASKEPYLMLGFGSNVLIPDLGIRTQVIRLGRAFRYCEKIGASRFRVGGSYPLMTLSRELSEDGFSGLEFAGGIPGSVGGAVRMNAGAHGSSISEVFVAATVLSPEAEILKLEKKDFSFAYRESGLPDASVIVEAEFELVSSSKEQTKKRRSEMLNERKARQPLQYASAGSVFRNPSPERSAGRIIEEMGLKGAKKGGAMISELHANWIINPQKDASSEDVIYLIEMCREKAIKTYGVNMRPEIKIW